MRISDWSSDVCSSDLIAAGETVPVAVSGRFLFGAPAADLAVTAEVVVGVDPQPFPDWADYRFGLATEEWTAIRAELAAGTTDAAGKGQIEAVLPRSEEHKSELPSLMRNPYAVFCLK